MKIPRKKSKYRLLLHIFYFFFFKSIWSTSLYIKSKTVKILAKNKVKHWALNKRINCWTHWKHVFLCAIVIVEIWYRDQVTIIELDCEMNRQQNKINAKCIYLCDWLLNLINCYFYILFMSMSQRCVSISNGYFFPRVFLFIIFGNVFNYSIQIRFMFSTIASICFFSLSQGIVEMSWKGNDEDGE